MQLSLKDFRCYKDKTFNLGEKGITLISGSSGKGKSTILIAIYFVLYGSGTKLVSYGSVTGPRIITSPLYVDGTFGQSFSYNLTASGSPSGYTILNLPDGLTFVPATGAISGTPTQAGTFPATLVVDY